MDFTFRTRSSDIKVTIPDSQLPAGTDPTQLNTIRILEKLVPMLFEQVATTLNEIVEMASDEELALLAPVLAQRSSDVLEAALVQMFKFQRDIEQGEVSIKEIATSQRAISNRRDHFADEPVDDSSFRGYIQDLDISLD